MSERSSCSIHSLILSQSRDMRLRNFAALTTVGLRVQESSESVEGDLFEILEDYRRTEHRKLQ